MVLEKENAVSDLELSLLLANPTEAEEGTIVRTLLIVWRNIIHGSDSVENGQLESNYFFAESDIVAVKGA